MKRFVDGVDRGQSTLFPECLEDWINEDNPVRVIDVFVEELDLAELGFARVDPKVTGRPSYHPSVLLKLYIYGYLNRVQSSRRLEREAGRNVEVMWLTSRLVPDHKTTADFRKDNGRAIGQVCSRFIALCRMMGLFTNASVAIDGSKFKAVNNRDKNFTHAKMKRRLEQIEQSIGRYLHQMDSADRQEPSPAGATKTTRLKDKIVKLKEEMQRLEKLDVQMRAAPDQQISLTDPDSRSMATSGRGSGVVGYNVQAAVETKHHLIIAHDVTNVGTDRAQLSRMAKQTKEILGTDSLDVVADRGYFSGEEILACDMAGITVTLPKPLTSATRSRGGSSSRTSAMWLRRMFTSALPVNGSPTTTPTRKTACDCDATGPAPVRLVRSGRNAPRAKSGGSPAGSMSMWSRLSCVGSTNSPKECVSGARRSSIPSARSRTGWAQPTS
jgi:transposase